MDAVCLSLLSKLIPDTVVRPSISVFIDSVSVLLTFADANI